MNKIALSLIGVAVWAPMGCTLTGKNNSALNDPVAVLKKADAAVKNAKLVRYDATYKGTGWVAALVANVEGNAVIGQRTAHDVERFRCDVTIAKKDSQEKMKYTVGCNGDVYFLVDTASKTVYEDMDPEVMGSNGRNLQRIKLDKFASATGFTTELEMATKELRGKATVGGVECYEVYVKPAEGRGEAIWSISTKDFLPRRVVRYYRNREDEEATTALELTNLTLDAKAYGDKPFATPVPAGFTKTDDFAP